MWWTSAEIPYDVRHTILLPPQHHLATLIVRRAHLRVLHNGVKETLKLDPSFGLSKVELIYVKKCIHQCAVWKKYEEKPLV